MAFWVLCSVLWISRKFGNPTVEQFLFHIQYGAEGLEGFDIGLVYSYARHAVIGPAVYSLLALIAEDKLTWLYKKKKFLSKPVQQYLKVLISVTPVLVLCWGLNLAYSRFSVGAYLSDEHQHDYFAEHYVSPADIQITQVEKAPKNLVLIYVESLESIYSDAGIFGKDLLAPLNAVPGVHFEKFRQVPGTDWTIAGITASQCGLPLKPLAVIDKNRQGQLFKNFLGNATCLGDTLNSLGYKNIFMGGANLDFAGKRKFLTNHGYTELYGTEEWLATKRYTKDDFHAWGLHDDDLFTEARHRLDQLQASGERFNLTLLTVNTHFPDGFISEACARRGGQDFTDVVTCSAHDVADFINYIKQQGYLKNTNVVVLGDHLTMPNAVYDKIADIEDRKIYNLWVSEPMAEPNRDRIIHFDFAATILEFIGYKVHGNRYGLGYSAFYTARTMPAVGRVVEIREKILNQSKEYQKLWVGHLNKQQ